MILTLASIQSARTDYQNPSTNYSSATTESFSNTIDELFTKFSSLSSTYQYRNLVSADIYLYLLPVVKNVGGIESVSGTHAYISEANGSWSQSTLTYNNKPGSSLLASTGSVYDVNGSWVHTKISTVSWIKTILEYGSTLKPFPASYSTYATQYGTIHTSRSSLAPYMLLELSDEDCYRYVYSASPASGYLPKGAANYFSWSTDVNGNCYSDITVTDNVFRYRADSSSAYTEVDCGTATNYTLPASTITTDSFQWQVAITDSTGHTATSNWYTISTLEVLSTANVIEPKNTIIDGSQETVFKWEHIISTSTEQSAADLQYSTDNSTWSTLGTVTGSSKTLAKAADFFTAGQYYWRVRTYNTDNNPGTWSDGASFVVIAAPTTPSVTSTSEPRPTVSWQSSGQQGYEVVIEGVYDSETRFGTDTSFTIPEFLEDGNYTAKVRVQNQYGLWSEYGTAPLTVANTSGPTITLIADTTDGTAKLQWTERSAYAAFLVYRDDEAIAKVTDYMYEDKYALGTHKYKVRGIYAGSTNYYLSNEVTAVISVDSLRIVSVSDDTQLDLEYTSSAYNMDTISQTSTSVLTYITAADYPMIEKSRFKSKTLAFTVAFVRGSSDIDTFKSLLGEIVCVKTAKGNMVIGSLDEVAESESTFYVEFTCSVQQIHWEESVTL